MGVSGTRQHIIVIGGGIAGLFSARELAKQNCAVTVLEATGRTGGRIHTLRGSGFSRPVEKGVEFIHGDLPRTMQLLEEFGIDRTPVGGDMIRIVNGEWKRQQEFAIGWDKIIQRMDDVEEDLTMDEFLQKYFADKKYAELRKSVCRFAQGFDLADTSIASVLALREEWMGEEEEQLRIPGGFDQLVGSLEKQCRVLGCTVNTSSPATEIHWQKGKVTVRTTDKNYTAEKVMITVPLGVLQSKNPIFFQPAIAARIEAAKRIGFGNVVRVLVEFKELFWKEKNKNLGFLFTEEIIPTWWTQSPSSYPLLTGWAGGPQAWLLENKDDEAIMELALESLSHIFNKPVPELKQLLVASLVANWKNEGFTNGAYSYSLVGSTTALKLFNEPVEDTLFFAGEAYYDGPSPGTVEAALISAGNAVGRVIGN